MKTLTLSLIFTCLAFVHLNAGDKSEKDELSAAEKEVYHLLEDVIENYDHPQISDEPQVFIYNSETRLIYAGSEQNMSPEIRGKFRQSVFTFISDGNTYYML